MSEKYSTIQQHQPLRVPDGWNQKERSLILQIEEIFDDLYRRFNRLNLKDLSPQLRKTIVESVEKLELTITKDENGEMSLKTSKVTINPEGIHLASDGTFTVASEKFSINDAGEMVAEGGSIGGWTIDEGKLYSGEGENHVRLSTEDEKYAIWAGSETPEKTEEEESEGAPFRVAKDGTVFLTKLYTLDEENNVATPVNLSNNVWKLNAAVKTLSNNNGEIEIELYNGNHINFKSASSVDVTSAYAGSNYTWGQYGTSGQSYRASVPVNIVLNNGKTVEKYVTVEHTVT